MQLFSNPTHVATSGIAIHCAVNLNIFFFVNAFSYSQLMPVVTGKA